MSDNLSNLPRPIQIKITFITGIFVLLAAIIGLGQPVISRLVDTYWPLNTPTPYPFLQKTPNPSVYDIAFMSKRDGNQEIYVMKSDGSNPIRLTKNTSRDDFPSWSPDGNYIAFESDRSGNSAIYIMCSDGSYQTKITDSDSKEAHPTWAPDGNQIVFSANDNGIYGLFILNIISHKLKRIPISDKDNIVPVSPSWSPDGQFIAFTGYVNENENEIVNTDIYIIKVDGSGLTRLTDTPDLDLVPSWSPDSQYIVYSSKRSGDFDIYIMKADGTEQQPLTNMNSPFWDVDPDWSSDGKYIVFWSARLGEPDIFLYSIQDQSITNLTNNPMADSGPTWVKNK